MVVANKESYNIDKILSIFKSDKEYRVAFNFFRLK